MPAGVPAGSVPAAPAQAQAAAPSSAPVPTEAVPAADEPQASMLAMHTLGDGEVAGQHALPVQIVKLTSAVCSI